MSHLARSSGFQCFLFRYSSLLRTRPTSSKSISALLSLIGTYYANVFSSKNRIARDLSLSTFCSLTLLSIFTIIIFVNLLDFLVTSETRKELLKLLWVDNLEASGHQLAQLAGAAYSAVHSELDAMKNEGLVVNSEKGKAIMFKKNNEYTDWKALTTLLAAIPKRYSGLSRKPTDEEVRLNLSKFGAPLAVYGETELDLSLEETVAYGLFLARRDSTVARVLPVVLAQNKDVMDFPRLEFLARKLEVLPVLGMFLDLTASLLKSQKLHRLARSYDDRRRKLVEDFFVNKKSNPFENELAARNTPPVAHSWRFRLNMPMDSFENLFRKTFPKGQPA